MPGIAYGKSWRTLATEAGRERRCLAIGLALRAEMTGNRGLSPIIHVDSNPLKYFDPDGRSKLQGTTSLGGNDPLIPRNINANTPRNEVTDAIKKIDDAIKADPKMNPARKRMLQAWKKVAKRGFTKAICPPFLEELAMAMQRELCLQGDIGACMIYEDLGGDVIRPGAPPDL